MRAKITKTITKTIEEEYDALEVKFPMGAGRTIVLVGSAAEGSIEDEDFALDAEYLMWLFDKLPLGTIQKFAKKAKAKGLF